MKLRLTAAASPEICFRKSVAPQARKIRVAPSAIRFIITFSVSEEVLEVYLAESYLEYKLSFPENRSSAGYHWKRQSLRHVLRHLQMDLENLQNGIKYSIRSEYQDKSGHPWQNLLELTGILCLRHIWLQYLFIGEKITENSPAS